MKRKKIGATLLTVVTMCSALLITGTAVTSMMVSDYKMKQFQSNRTHNLYGADSGLDAAHDVLVADFDAAGNYAGFKVQQLKAGKNKFTDNQSKYNLLINEDTNLEKNNPDKSPAWYEEQRKRIQKNKDIVINAEFQRSFKLFLNSSWAKSYQGEYIPNQLNTINTTDVKNEIKYVSQINKSGTENDKTAVDLDTDITEGNFVYKSVAIKSNPIIKVNALDITVNDKAVTASQNVDEVNVATNGYASPDNYTVKQSAVVKVSSTFETADGKDGKAVVGPNQRTVESTYNIVIPNYDDIYFINQEYKPYIYNVYNGKGITVFGNMQVKDMGTSNFTVANGDVFVLGNEKNLPTDSISATGINVSSPHIVDKYHGGISIDGNTTAKTQIEFCGNVFTGNTFNIERNINVKLDKDIYAQNVYAGKQNGETGDNSSLNVIGSMIVDNDLTLKSTATDISIYNFYGINDKYVKDNTDTNKDRNSSSILVNTYKDDNNDKKSSVNITGEAYIMGVAYIDTDTPYQTGESIGVKGNYNAYSQESDADIKKFTFGAIGTINPLYLINGKVTASGAVDGNITVDDKDKHFFNFWNNDKNKLNLETGGVTLPKAIGNIHSAGAIVYTDGNDQKQVRQSSYDLDNTPTTILQKQRDYAKYVYNLGNAVVDTTNSGMTQDQLLSNLYNSPYSRTNLIGAFMDLSQLSDTQTGQLITNDVNVGLFNKETSKRVVIKGQGSTVVTTSNDIVINASSGQLSAFIATAGDLIIDGGVNLNGNIIVRENLIVQGTGNKTITYNDQIAQSIQRKVPSVFAQVFKLGGSIQDATSLDESNLKVDYDLGKFLKNTLWKIAK